MNDEDVEARVAMLDARNWTAHLAKVTGAPRRIDVHVVQVRTTGGNPGKAIKCSLWSAPN